MMGLLVAGLFIFCLLAYFVLMFLFPEWVGISKKDENKTDSSNEALSSFLESKGTRASDSEITNTEKVRSSESKNPTKD